MAAQAKSRISRERRRDARAPGGIGTVSLPGPPVLDPRTKSRRRRSLAGGSVMRIVIAMMKHETNTFSPIVHRLGAIRSVGGIRR